MQTGKIMRFKTIEDMQSAVVEHLEYLKKEVDEYSKLIGEKFREAESNKIEDLADLKEKLDGSVDPKKKKPTKKKDQKGNWLNFGDVAVYDGIGLKGELELYFKAIEELKSRMEKIEKVKLSVDNLIAKGLKKELSCVGMLGNDFQFEMSFIKSKDPNAKFVYQAIFNTETESVHAINI